MDAEKSDIIIFFVSQ